MNIQEYESGPTSNDFLESRVAENNSATLDDSIGAHRAAGGPNIDDAPTTRPGS
jgi:hypothetical protein